MTEKLFNEIAAWQQDTFPGGTPDSTLHHLLDEIRELRYSLRLDPASAAEELADCMFLIFGCADRMGMSYQDIQDAIAAKFAINKARKWGKPKENGVVNHVEEPPVMIASPVEGAVIVEGVKPEIKTIGQLLTDAFTLNELKAEVVENELGFPAGMITSLMNDNYYTNSVPVVLFKNLILSLHIRPSDVYKAMIPTFNAVRAKETPEKIKKKPHGYQLWENKEAVKKYTAHLKKLIEAPVGKQNQSTGLTLPANSTDILMDALRKSEIN